MADQRLITQRQADELAADLMLRGWEIEQNRVIPQSEPAQWNKTVALYATHDEFCLLVFHDGSRVLLETAYAEKGPFDRAEILATVDDILAEATDDD